MALQQERIYTIEDIYALPDGQRAELIDGRIYNMAPPSTMHQRILILQSGNTSKGMVAPVKYSPPHLPSS